MDSKRQAFIEHYLICWNGAEAARRAGYAEGSARQAAHRLLTNADVQSAIRLRLADLQASADEVLARLTQHARGSMADFVRLNRDGEPEINLSNAAASDKLHLLRKIKTTKKVSGDAVEKSVEIELYDAQAALTQLGRHHRLFVDRVEGDWAAELRSLGIDPQEVEGDIVALIQQRIAARAAVVDSARE